ncbi:unnamed protein product [Brassicogethes aeneus]|uniref:Gamma-tubulin complex component n=1 Tax=Brassicogethes aeneus TaxID=1431903 RepID=A0A9P0FEV0_BRAAE|nr:unnamed protein product [Brassicogethes aeneus]
MIHETLFNIWNCPGEFLDKTDWTYLLELQEFSHPGEEKLLLWIIEIAMDYHKICAFTKQVLNPIPAIPCPQLQDSFDKDKSVKILPPGLYTQAFCMGTQKVLEGYRKEIIRLEEMFLENPALPLTYILSTIEGYRGLFSLLKTMIQTIQTENLHGCLLMGRLHKYINCGNQEQSMAADKIIQSINTIFYRHLCNWIIYGDLVDIYGEFFICDGKTADENFQGPTQLDESTIDVKKHSQFFKRTRIQPPPLVRKFFINWKMVPIFIDEETAESILFMGRIVWIVRNDPKNSGDENYEIKYKRDIWEGKDMEYYKKLQALESQSFNKALFQKTIEECRLKLTKYLWTVMLDEGHLMEHLQLIRDYYALGRGELFQQFVTVAEKQMNNRSTNSIVQNLNSVFLETARKIYGENDKTYLKFELATSRSNISKTNLWARLKINFEVNWPLHIVFHPKVMELYNKLFCYLLRMKKTQIDLHKLWQLHALKKGSSVDRRVWTLRQKLMFLVNNLQYYLQVDVIEAQFSVLLKAVKNASEFEDIIKLHHDFVSNLLAKTFLLTPDDSQTYDSKHKLYQIPAIQYNEPSKVYNVIIHLLELCDEFCLVATTWELILTEPEVIDLNKFQKECDIVVESLLLILQSLHEKASGQHLLQLILQLDYNKYFSKNRMDLNLTMS